MSSHMSSPNSDVGRFNTVAGRTSGLDAASTSTSTSPSSSTNTGQAQRRSSRDTTGRRRSAAAAAATATATPPAHTNGSGKKGVRTLTEAQLEKKRANDRDAQRAIRERTRKQIETLEQRIRDLESGAAFQQLQDALRQKEVVSAENAELKQRLASALDILRPLARLLPTTGETAIQLKQASGQLSAPQASLHEYKLSTDHTLTPNTSSIGASPSQHFDQYNRGLEIHANGHEWSTNNGDLYRQAAASGPLWEPARSDGSSAHTIPQGITTAQTHPHMPTYDFEMGTKRKRDPFNEIDRKNYYNFNQPAYSRGPIHAQQPLNIAPTCRLDTILFDYASDARNRLAQGIPLDTIIGPPYPVFNSMLDPSVSMEGHSLSELLIEVLKGFSAIRGIAEKIGVITHMFLTVRWIISPSLETYTAMPEWVRPVEEQLKVAHPIWIDYIPWPKMRAKMCYHYPQLPLDNFFLPYSSTLSANYHSNDIASCLYRFPPDNEEFRARPELDIHVRDIDNWSLGIYFAQSLPALVDTCRIKKGGDEDVGI